jgi:hypothetical protein
MTNTKRKPQTPVPSTRLVRQMTREQVSDVLYDVAKIGHYVFDKTSWLKKWLRQAVRAGMVKQSDLRRYMRKLPNH